MEMFAFWFSPVGRAARADYWYWLICPFVISIAILLYLGPLIFSHSSIEVIVFMIFVVFVISHMAMAIKRLHDLNISGWYSTALILPFVVAGAFIADPHLVDFGALEKAPDDVRLTVLGVFSVVFAPFAYVLGHIWLFMGNDGTNRYGRDPLYR